MSSGKDRGTPTIARIWRGRTRRKDAEAYAVYMAEVGLRDMERNGALGVQMFREHQGDETIFMALTYWESFETMAAWAGDDPFQVRHLPRDPEFLIEMPERVQVLEIVENTWSELALPVVLLPVVSFSALEEADEVEDVALARAGSIERARTN